MFFRFGSFWLMIFILSFMLPYQMNELEAHGGGRGKGRNGRKHRKESQHDHNRHHHDNHHSDHHDHHHDENHGHHHNRFYRFHNGRRFSNGGGWYGGDDAWGYAYGYNRGNDDYPYDPYDYQANYPTNTSSNNLVQDTNAGSDFHYYNTFSINESVYGQNQSTQDRTCKRGVFFNH